MSRQFRYRVTAIVLGGLVFGVPMLVNGTAIAEQANEAGGRQVTFSGGGMMGLSCESKPNVESLTVPADSTIRVVNRTGYSAQLQLGGDTKGTLPDDAATEVVFRRGTTAVLLKPNCPLGEDTTPVLVTAAPSASAVMPDPIPAPSSGTADAVTSAPAGSSRPAGTASRSNLPDSAASAHRPARVDPPGTRRTPVSRPTTVAQAATAAAQGMSHGATAPRVRTKTKATTLTRTPGSAAPMFAGMPPGDEKAIVQGVPQLDVAPMTQVAVPPVQPEPAERVAEPAAAEPVAAMRPMSDDGPVGMLALIAAVCVLGVGAAAIRAFVSHRANRARIA